MNVIENIVIINFLYRVDIGYEVLKFGEGKRVLWGLGSYKLGCLIYLG